MSGINENLILVRGGGDLATGTIYKLRQCGFDVLVLETENPSAIRRNVAFADIYDPTGAVRAAARNPASVFRTQFHKAVALDMLHNRCPRLTFVIYQDGQPQIAILLSPKAAYKAADMQLVVDRMGLALRQKNIAFQRYYREFRNDEAYVRERVREDLGW